MNPDPKHRASLQKLVQLPITEIRRQLAIEKFKDPEFVASEVLVTMVRMRFGLESGLLDRVVNVLYGRLMRLIDQYFRKNPQWHGVVNSSSETLAEATSTAWVVLNADSNPVSFAEVRFLPWVQARAEDYLQEQLAQKNSMPSYDASTEIDEEGEATGAENLLKADKDDQPDAIAERRELSLHLQDVLLTLDPRVRRVVYLRLGFRYDWDKVAELMGVTKPTARKYYNIGIEQLNGAIHE